MSGAIGCRGASWSVRNSADWSREYASFSGHCLPILLHRLQEWCVDSKGGVVAQTRFRKFESSNLSSELTLVASAFFRRGSPRTREASIRGEYLIGDGSIAYDRSFA